MVTPSLRPTRNMPEMRIVERQVGRVVILDFHGRIVVGQGANLLRAAVTRLADSGSVNILLNLADVPFIDSSVVGELVRSLTTASRKGGAVKLLNLPPKVRNLLSMARLLTVFQAYESEDEAVRSF
jgi:anti-sigma B factor antagonist